MVSDETDEKRCTGNTRFEIVQFRLKHSNFPLPHFLLFPFSFLLDPTLSCDLFLPRNENSVSIIDVASQTVVQTIDDIGGPTQRSEFRHNGRFRLRSRYRRRKRSSLHSSEERSTDLISQLDSASDQQSSVQPDASNGVARSQSTCGNLGWLIWSRSMTWTRRRGWT